MRMRTGLVLWVIILTACAAQAGEPIYVVPGVGIKGGIHINDRRSAATAWKQEPLQKAPKKSGKVSYQTNERGAVVLIRCEEPACVTDYGVSVGSQKSEILKRYGAPRTEGKPRKGEYYEYDGIGFELDQRGIVTGIIVFPR